MLWEWAVLPAPAQRILDSQMKNTDTRVVKFQPALLAQVLDASNLPRRECPFLILSAQHSKSALASVAQSPSVPAQHPSLLPEKAAWGHCPRSHMAGWRFSFQSTVKASFPLSPGSACSPAGTGSPTYPAQLMVSRTNWRTGP